MTGQEAARTDEIEQVVTAIQSRIDSIRATVPDVVPGDYQIAFADGMASAVAEIRAVFPPATTEGARHEIRYPSASDTVACSCGWWTAVPLGHSLHDAYLDQHHSQVTSPDPICNERGIPQSECPSHCRHDHRSSPGTSQGGDPS